MVCLDRLVFFFFFFTWMVRKLQQWERRICTRTLLIKEKQTMPLRYKSLTVRLILIKLKGAKLMAKIYFTPLALKLFSF